MHGLKQLVQGVWDLRPSLRGQPLADEADQLGAANQRGSLKHRVVGSASFDLLSANKVQKEQYGALADAR